MVMYINLETHMNQDLRDSIDQILLCPKCDEDFIKRIANTNRIYIEEKTFS